MKLVSRLLLLMTIVFVASHAQAGVTNILVTPASVNFQASTSITIDGGPPSKEIGDLLDKTQPIPRLIVVPMSFSVLWNPLCTPISGNAAVSQRGLFVLNGRTIGATGILSTVECELPADPLSRVNETVILPQTVLDAVMEELLKTRFADVDSLSGRPLVITVDYTRTFVNDGGGLTKSVPLNFTITSDIVVNQSRLVSVKSTGPKIFIPIQPGAGAPASIPPVTWITEIVSTGRGSQITVRSDRIEYRTPSGQLLYTQNKPLFKQFNPAFAGAGQNRTLTSLAVDSVRAFVTPAQAVLRQPTRLSRMEFRETLTIPKTVYLRAQQLGASRVVVIRTFSDGTYSFTGDFLLPLGGASLFQITRVDLHFPNGERSKVVAENDPLSAVVDINYLSTGQLFATWEWAPIITGGAPLFRPLPASVKRMPDNLRSADYYAPRNTMTMVREYLTSFKRASLRSPPLPTDKPGTYVLRLRIDSPKVAFTLPVIQYFVGVEPVPGARARERDLLPLIVTSPQPGREAMPAMNFKWSGVPGTAVYRFEVYLDEGLKSGMVTGALVRGESSDLTLSPLVHDHLQSGKEYWCRIVAINSNGQTYAASTPFRMRVP